MQVLNKLRELLGPGQVLTEKQLKDRFVHIWNMDTPLQAKAVLLPENTEQVSNILKICNQHKQPIVVHGGLTNLVGSTETAPDEMVVSLEKMNRIIDVDLLNKSMTVESGVILESVQRAAENHDLFFPLNFGAKGSAQMGGIISTNAGGLRVFRYGMMRDLVLGLEVVLADGSILSSMKKIIKDNSGYDLKQLFIGAEGTLGIITKAMLKLRVKPTSRCSAFIACRSYTQVLHLFSVTNRHLSDILSGFELIGQKMYEGMTLDPGHIRPPLAFGFPYYVLMETMGSDLESDRKLLTNCLERLLSEEAIEDAVIADSDADLRWFWQIREDVGLLSQPGQIDQHFDVSLPMSVIGDYIETVHKQLSTLSEINTVYTFGHIADGNIHFVVAKNSDSISLKDEINHIIYAPLQALNGSVSAEHGIGMHKKSFLSISKSKVEIDTMKKIKMAMDPSNILNRGKIFSL